MAVLELCPEVNHDELESGLLGRVEDPGGLDRTERKLGTEPLQRQLRQRQQTHPEARLDSAFLERQCVGPVVSGQETRDLRRVEPEPQVGRRVGPGRI